MPILGYIAPPQVLIKVPDSASGTGGGGFSELPSVESWLQLAVQQMVGGPGENDESGLSSLKWSDAEVSAHLADVAASRAPWLTGISAADGAVIYFDPNAEPSLTAGLIQKYTRVFRQAVSTPAPPPLPPWMVPRVKPADPRD